MGPSGGVAVRASVLQSIYLGSIFLSRPINNADNGIHRPLGLVLNEENTMEKSR